MYGSSVVPRRNGQEPPLVPRLSPLALPDHPPPTLRRAGLGPDTTQRFDRVGCGRDSDTRDLEYGKLGVFIPS